jgi:hypothetical protein
VKQRVRHSHGSLLGWRPCERKTTSPWLADAKLVDDHHQSERWRASVGVLCYTVISRNDYERGASERGNNGRLRMKSILDKRPDI